MQFNLVATNGQPQPAFAFAIGVLVIFGRVNLKSKRLLVDKQATQIKQGAYGKVKTHKESMIMQLLNVGEIFAAVQLRRLCARSNSKLDANVPLTTLLNEVDFCGQSLKKVSRSFSLVITFLQNKPDSPLRLAVSAFYLVLRALDTIEDEMDLTRFDPFVLPIDEKESKAKGFAVGIAVKKRLLENFYKRLSLDSKEQVVQDIGEGDELVLLNDFYKVVKVVTELPKDMQKVISDVTKEMGGGMSEYSTRNFKNGTLDDDDFSRYCYFVAGLVGRGLTELFAFHDESYGKLLEDDIQWKSMGEFLQRTNIIRDYLEDIVDGRAFWPESVWKQYIPENEESQLKAFAKPSMIKSGHSVALLNHMVADALDLVPEVMKYLSTIKDPYIYSFCALPQIMALATLAQLYQNEKVFTGVVKIRKGTAVKIMRDLFPTGDNCLDQLQYSCKSWCTKYLDALSVNSKYKNSSPTDKRVGQTCTDIKMKLSQFC